MLTGFSSMDESASKALKASPLGHLRTKQIKSLQITQRNLWFSSLYRPAHLTLSPIPLGINLVHMSTLLFHATREMLFSLTQHDGGELYPCVRQGLIFLL